MPEISRRHILLMGAVAPVLASGIHDAWGAPGGRHGPEGKDVPASAASSPLGSVGTAARWAIALDHDTGTVLLEKDADAPMAPSSMTKMMTAYVVYGLLREDRLHLGDRLPVSERAWRTGGSKMFVKVGAEVTVEDLIRGMIVQSGNDACIVLAEGTSGSEAAFADMMNAKAEEIGLKDSHFTNSTGLPDPGHRMTVRDIAHLAQRLITDFPEYYKYDAEKSFSYNGISQENRNTLVQRGLADGLKTGHTDEGGYGIAASSVRGGRRLILVVNGLASMHQRAEEAERLLGWAFRSFQNAVLVRRGQEVERPSVWLASSQVAVTVPQDVVVTVPHTWRADRNGLKLSPSYSAPLSAPIARGQQVGTLHIHAEGIPDMDVPLVAAGDSPRVALLHQPMAAMEWYVGQALGR